MRNIKTRDGFEFWDKLNALPRYAFLLSPSGKSVQKFEDQAMGNWVDVHEAQQIIDQAEERISERQDELGEVSRQLEKFRSRSHGIKNLSAIEARDDQIGAASLKINALQQRLTAADERLDAGISFVTRMIKCAGGQPSIATSYLRDILDKLKPAKGGKPSTCTWSEGGFSWHTGCGKEWQFTDGGLPAENGMRFCHSCGKTLVVEGEPA